jgi:PadR family transcriptional regulator, regulatory protein AphA
MSNIRLTPTSYIVLGLVSAASEATPYQLKQQVANGIGSFWSVPHAQLYSEPDRLAAAGLLKETAEKTGRRRKRYRITAAGRKALDLWLATPTHGFTELRDPGLLQLFLGADPVALAKAQLEVHRPRLREYEQLRDEMGQDAPRGLRLVLDSGIGHEREWVRFWEAVVKER